MNARTNPYTALPPRSFWRTGAAEPAPFGLDELWAPKFRYDRMPIVTAGSCFAQHFGRAMSAFGFKWHIGEKPPGLFSEDQARRFNYGLFSFRTGNIYTVKALLQWLQLSSGALADEEVWQDNGRYFDPLRPAIEAGGFASVGELMASRDVTIEAIRTTLSRGCIFVFTLGLTEAWENKSTGLQYAMCPGTHAGSFDANTHAFINEDFAKTYRQMRDAVAIIRSYNQKNKVLLTVSPVPLTATASADHVLVATVRSKSLLRTVANETKDKYEFVDYFPSYEIITGTPFRSVWYKNNLRTVLPEGVDFVMRQFLSSHDKSFPPAERRAADQSEHRDEVCEEVLLDAFAQ